MIISNATITVDFNNSDEDGLVFARAARASRVLQEGEVVFATDQEEAGCEARVARIVEGLIYLDIDWDTWTKIEITTSTSGLEATELEPSFVSNGGADLRSESAPVQLMT